MKDGDQFCERCGSKVSGGTAAGQVSSYNTSIREKSAGAAVVLSFFFMGLGQLYVGKIVRGLLLMLANVALSIVSICALFIWVDNWADTYWYGSTDAGGEIILMVVCMILGIALWVWNLFDAYRLANKYNDAVMRDGKRPW